VLESPPVAIDLQVVFPQEAVQLSQVQLIAGPPRGLKITGEDFRSVDEVLLNGIASPSVVVLSKTSLIAQIPSQLGAGTIVTATVLSNRLTVTPRSLLRFRVGKTPGRASGLQKLVQLFLKVLFTTPGTDIFNPTLGGGALRNVGATYGPDQGNDLVNDLVIAIDTTSRQIIAVQGRNPSLPREERLLSAKVAHVAFNKAEGALDVRISLTSQAGHTASANLEL
jgi:hypothetical protein